MIVDAAGGVRFTLFADGQDGEEAFSLLEVQCRRSECEVYTSQRFVFFCHIFLYSANSVKTECPSTKGLRTVAH